MNNSMINGGQYGTFGGALIVELSLLLIECRVLLYLRRVTTTLHSDKPKIIVLENSEM